jgi:hypothetical protein
MIEEPGYNRKKRRKKGKTKKEWEKLREAPIVGISTMADGSLVSAPISGKALPRLGRAIRSSMTSGVITGDQNPLTRVDGNQNGLIFDGTWREMPDPTPGNRGGVSGRIGRRDNPTKFVGLDTLLAKHFAQSEQFDEWEKNNDWNSFHRNHFDWWMFPIPRGSNSYGDGYNIVGEPLETLKADKRYMQSLAKSVRQYFRAMAWDIDKNDWVKDADFNNGQNPIRNINSARLYKIAQSTYAHGMMDEHRSIRRMANSLINSNVRVGNEDYWTSPIGVSGRMALGRNINPTKFEPVGENSDPFSDNWKRVWDSRDDMSPGYPDKLWDWRNEEERRKYGQNILGKKVKKGYLVWGLGDGPGKTSKVLGELSGELLPILQRDFGILHQRVGTYPAFQEPYGKILTHSASPYGQSADANIVRDILGKYHETLNPSEFYTRFEAWIRNPFVTIRDPKSGKDVGVRKHFNNDRQLMLAEFRSRVKNLFDSAYMREHGQTYDQWRGPEKDAVELSPKEILSALKTTHPDVIDKSKALIPRILNANPRSMHRFHSIFSDELSLRASQEDIRLITPGVLREIIKENTPSFDDDMVKKFPDFFEPDALADLNDSEIELARIISDSLIEELIEFDEEDVKIPQASVAAFAETMRGEFGNFTDSHARSILTDSVLRLNPQGPRGGVSGKMSTLKPSKSMKDYVDDPQLDLDAEAVGKSIGFWGGWPVIDDPELGEGFGEPSVNYKNHPVYSYDLETGKPVKILGLHSTSEADIESIIKSKKYEIRGYGNFGQGGNFSFDGDPYMTETYGEDLSRNSTQELEKIRRLVVRLELENPVVVNVGVLEPTEDTKPGGQDRSGARKNRYATLAERQEEYIKQLGGTERVRGLYKLLLDAANGGNDTPAGVKISFTNKPSPEQIKYYEKIVNGGEINMHSRAGASPTQELNLLARAAGHDGIVWINTPGNGAESSHVIAFDEDKIKVLGARPAYSKESAAYHGGIYERGRDWTKYNEAMAKRKNSQSSPGSVSGKMSLPDSIEAEYIGYDSDDPTHIANHMLSRESSYDVRPEPVDDIKTAIETGAPLRWLMPGSYHPQVEEFLNNITEHVISNGYDSIEDVREMGTGDRDTIDDFKAKTGEWVGELQLILARLGFYPKDRDLNDGEIGIIEAITGSRITRYSEIEDLVNSSEDPRAKMLDSLIRKEEHPGQTNMVAAALVARASHAGFKTNFLASQSQQGRSATDDTLDFWQRSIYSSMHNNSFEGYEDRGYKPEIAVSMPVEALLKMLTGNGEYKTVFDEGATSRGNNNENVRFMQEFTMFGYLPGYRGKRPVYGVVAPGGLTPESLEYTHNYGSMKIVLKPEVRDRSTWTESDSLSIVSTASSFSNPSKHGLVAENLKGDLEQFAKQDLYIEDGEPIPTVYTEAQIHGGVTVDDIAYIVVDDRFYNSDWYGRMNWPQIDAEGNPTEELPDSLDEYGPFIQISKIAESLQIPVIRADAVIEAGEKVVRP